MSILKLFLMMVSNRVWCAVNQIMLVSIDRNISRYKINCRSL